jgi:hypothetical protein
MSELVERYTKVVRVIGMHAEGKTIRKALREVGGVTRQLFERMCAENEDLKTLRLEAARCFRESYHDLLLNIDDDPDEGRTDAKMAAVISSNIKHVLAVDDPEKFGNRLKVEHNITASEAIVAALEAGRRRAGLGPVIDAVVVSEVVGAAEERIETLPPPSSSAAVVPPGALDDPFAALAASLG